MPVLYAGRNVNAVAGSHLDRVLAPFGAPIGNTISA